MGFFFKKKKSAKEDAVIAEQPAVEVNEQLDGASEEASLTNEKTETPNEADMEEIAASERPYRVLLEELDDEEDVVETPVETVQSEAETHCEDQSYYEASLLEELSDNDIAELKKDAKKSAAAAAVAYKESQPSETDEIKEEPAAEREIAESKEVTPSAPVELHEKPAAKPVTAKISPNSSATADDDGMKIVPTFKGKIIQSGSEIQIYYGKLVDLFTSFKKVKVRECKKRARVYSGRTLFGYVFFKGKKLCVTLAVDPSKYANTKYRGKDVSAKKRYAATPYMMKITSERKFKYLTAVIEEMLAGKERIQIAPRDYLMPFESDEQLLERGLAVKRRAVAFKPFGVK